MSRYATLLSDVSDSDSESPARGAPAASTTAMVCAAAEEPSGTPKQSGGTYAQRADPMTGVDWGKDTPVDTGFSQEDIEACVRVVAGLGRVPAPAPCLPIARVCQHCRSRVHREEPELV